MIIQRVFHVYKEDFPLLSNGRLAFGFDANALDDLFTGLILQLSDISLLPHFTYITRHTDDKIPQDRLRPFLLEYQDFVNQLGPNQPYDIPTVWFVGHFESQDLIANVHKKLGETDVKYFESGGEYNSFEEMNDTYWENKRDAQLFPEFLHQTTMIGIDLLSVPNFKEKLKQLGRLEWLQYGNLDAMESDLREMERYLDENSPYYKESLVPGPTNEFWRNFRNQGNTSTRRQGGVRFLAAFSV